SFVFLLLIRQPSSSSLFPYTTLFRSIVPDWYLLFSWGLLKVADVFPQFIIGDGTPLKTNFNAAFWGDILSGIPVIFLLILPFIDRGREARPAKAPVRSAFGIAFLLAWIFTAS